MAMKRPVTEEEYRKRKKGLSTINQYSPESELRKMQDVQPGVTAGSPARKLMNIRLKH